MSPSDFIPGPPEARPESGTLSWQAPSNIALVKYWGKKKGQLPMNPSVSFTLDACATRTRVRYNRVEGASGLPSFEITFEGRPAPHFREKIAVFFERILPYQPFLSGYTFEIDTENTFPHSSGIASSASGMAALALCLIDLERAHYPGLDPEYCGRKASFLARLGSGSASRSTGGAIVHWGAHGSVPGSSDLYGIDFPLESDPVFRTFQDTILLVDRGQKQVSSTAGHGLMQGHPYAPARFGQARDRIDDFLPIFREGDLQAFVELVESEALTLHAMMMTSQPYYILMKPATLQIIERIWEFRKAEGEPVCFTLDAGANVHLLYPAASREKVVPFIQDALLPFCEDGQHISDQVGAGPVRLNGD